MERGGQRVFGRRPLLRTAGLGTAALLGGCTALPVADAGRTLLGAYPGRDAWSPTTFGPFERWLGRKHAVLVLYVEAGDPPSWIRRFVHDRMTAVWRAGHVPMVTWLPAASDAAAPPDIEQRIREGGYDVVVERWADELRTWTDADDPPRRLYFRPMPEMNGDWLPWSATDGSTPAEFVGAWRRIHDLFSDAGLTADTLQWVWNPNATDHGGVRAEEYYPGDAYVDWIGIDGYNFGESRPEWEWRDPESVFGPMVERLRNIADKPLAFPEFGSSSYRDGAYRPSAKARWIADAYAFVRRSDVRMACWFNVDKETDWAVFGGGRGTTTYAADGTTIDAYVEYRRAARHDRMLAAGDGPRVLSDDAFAGRF